MVLRVFDREKIQPFFVFLSLSRIQILVLQHWPSYAHSFILYCTLKNSLQKSSIFKIENIPRYVFKMDCRFTLRWHKLQTHVGLRRKRPTNHKPSGHVLPKPRNMKPCSSGLPPRPRKVPNCRLCRNQFQDGADLQLHMQAVHVGAIFACQLCTFQGSLVSRIF